MAGIYPHQYVFARPANSAASVTTGSITTQSGSLLVAVMTCFTNKIGSTPITDSLGNTWTAAVASTGNTQGWAAIYYVANCTGGSQTFTFTPTSSDFIALGVYEIRGAAISSVLGSTNSSTTNSTTHASGTITSNGSVTECFIGVGAVSRAAENAPVLQGALWGPGTALGDGGTVMGLITAAKVVGPSVTDQFSYTTSSAFNETSIVAGFKAAAVSSSGGAWACA